MIGRTVRELLPDAIFISEPRYNKWEWITDEGLGPSIWFPKEGASAGVGIGKVSRERDFVFMELASWLFINCYFSSNVANNQIVDKLKEIGGILVASDKMAVVGDLNAKSPA